MYFSVLPLLLLLFASIISICASPVYIERRAASTNQAWPGGLTDHKSNPTFQMWAKMKQTKQLTLQVGLVNVHGVSRIDLEDQKFLLQFEMGDPSSLGGMKNLITDLEKNKGKNGLLVDWGWDGTTTILDFVVELHMQKGWEKIVEKYMATSPKPIDMSGMEHQVLTVR